MSTTTNPEFVAELIIPARAGRIELRGFFPQIPWKQVIVDEELMEFVANTKHYNLRETLSTPLTDEDNNPPNKVEGNHKKPQRNFTPLG